MISAKMMKMAEGGSAIRAMFEDGKKLAAQYGTENVYDFSLGNPSIPSPPCVNETVLELIRSGDPTLHAYTTAAGRLSLRQAIADDMHRRGGDCIAPELIYVTCGAASSLAISLKAVLFPGDEVLVMAPFFPEYRVFSEVSGGVIRVVPPRGDFQIDMDALKQTLSPKTKAVIIQNNFEMLYRHQPLS